ncbi:MAG: ABC transporter ATP-binding protein [Clostridia bacterium]|nr:ABC transporter ATP-binding protein [Clostridia bacterium]
MVLIKTDNLCKTYGNNENFVKAVDNINLEIDEGDLIAIVGTSGSGKTTLLHLLSGLDKPTSGKIVYKNTSVDLNNNKGLLKYRSRHIGFVFQFFNLIPILSVEENIYLPLMINGEKADKQYINSVIDILGIRSKLNSSITKLSGGQQQRVAIARALVHKPDIVFADEPTGALDSTTSNEIMQLLKDISNRFNQTLIIVTHDPLIANQCNRILSLEDGKIISDIRSEKKI